MARTKATAGKSIVSAVAAEDALKKRRRHRWRPGTVALREIRLYQKSTKLLLPKAAFERCVREALSEIATSSDLRVTKGALEAIQETVEAYMVEYIKEAYRYTIYRGKVELQLKDLELTKEVRLLHDNGSK